MPVSSEAKSTLGMPKAIAEDLLAADDTGPRAAGIVFVAPDGDVLLLRRSAKESNYAGHWGLPGGGAEDGETASQAALREAREEIGFERGTKAVIMKLLDRMKTPTGLMFSTFGLGLDDKFEPTLNDEHDEARWFPLNALPKPLHPSVARTLGEHIGVTEDMSPDDWTGLREGFLKWTREEAAEAEHALDEQIVIEVRDDDGQLAGLLAHIKKASAGGHSFEVVVDPKDAEYGRSFYIDGDGAFGMGEIKIGGKSYEPAHAEDDRCAMDRNSVRTYDADGRLHVELSNISKAAINDYLGREIPGYEQLGLDPAKRYRLLRDPEELAKAAPSFNNLPLLSRHVPITADDHPSDLVVGSLGTDATFEAPFLKNSLVIWRRDGIDDVESDAKKEISCGYRYRADMTPGTYQGQKYDGVMRDIVGNHVALVKEGRAGSDVVVGDEALPKINGVFEMKTTVLTRHAAVAQGAVLALLLPKLAQDAKIDLAPVFAGVTKKNFGDKVKDIAAGIAAATKGKLAQDADMGDVAKMLDALVDVEVAEGADTDPNSGLPMSAEEMDKAAMDDDPVEKIKAMLAGKVDDGVIDAIVQLLAPKPAVDADPDKKDDDEDKVTKPAMDAAINAAVEKTRKDMLANARAVRDAENAVRPYIGTLAIACDSAEDVYRHTLKTLGVKTEGVHPDALPAILAAQPVPGSRKEIKSAIAQDAATEKDFNERFPHAAKIGHA